MQKPTPDDVSALSGLTRLQSLAIKALGARQPEQQQQQQQPGSAGRLSGAQPSEKFPGCLTSLTHLRLQRDLIGELGTLSACSSLCSFHLLKPAAGQVYRAVEEFSTADWQAIGQLTHLTVLRVGYPIPASTAPAAAAALAKLVRLQTFAASKLVVDVLPVLQGLSHLTAMGGWAFDMQVNQATAPWPGVLELQASSPIPCQAFPNITRLLLRESVNESELPLLVKHCPRLRELGARVSLTGIKGSPTLRPGAQLSAQVAAIQSLTALHCLTRLDFAVADNGQLAALVGTANALAAHKLRHLFVILPTPSKVSAVALMQLSRVANVCKLEVSLTNNRNLSISSEEACMLLSHWAADRVQVGIVVTDDTKGDMFWRALDWLKDSGLPRPRRLTVKALRFSN